MLSKITTLANTNNKARIVAFGNLKYLYSYDTKVAEFNTKNRKLKIFGYHSLTTGRHINSFLEHFGLPTKTKKELFKEFNLKK